MLLWVEAFLVLMLFRLDCVRVQAGDVAAGHSFAAGGEEEASSLLKEHGWRSNG